MKTTHPALTPAIVALQRVALGHRLPVLAYDCPRATA